MQKTVIIITGPTASGKTKLVVDLSDIFPIDIISVDSSMIYRGMDIGTGKPSAKELKRYPHQLVDILDPSEIYSVSRFCHNAKSCIETSLKRNKIPVLVGGTMMYFHGLLNGLNVLPLRNDKIRSKLQAMEEGNGLSYLYERLRIVDPIICNKLHANDRQRIYRALEIYEMTSIPLSKYWEDSIEGMMKDYNFKKIAIYPERFTLHDNIKNRFLKMIKMGFIDEVEQFYNRDDLSQNLPSMRSVGYRQIWNYLDGNYNYQNMVEKSIVATRQLAKRQCTWLKKWDAQFYQSLEQAKMYLSSVI